MATWIVVICIALAVGFVVGLFRIKKFSDREIRIYREKWIKEQMKNALLKKELQSYDKEE